MTVTHHLYYTMVLCPKEHPLIIRQNFFDKCFDEMVVVVVVTIDKLLMKLLMVTNHRRTRHIIISLK